MMTLFAVALTLCSLASQPPTGSAALPPTTQPAGSPAITADIVEHDFGQVRAGAKVEHRLKITNTGSADLNITNVRTNCGCAVAGDYPRTLAPGVSGEIPLALTTANMNGPFQKTVTIYSNDPVRPQLTLTLKGDARPLIALQPAGIFFPAVYGEQSQTQSMPITNNTESPLKMVLDPLASKNGWTFDRQDIRVDGGVRPQRHQAGANPAQGHAPDQR